MPYPVKWYSSDMEGALSLGDTADGALAAMLKSVLVTGFGSRQVASAAYNSSTKRITYTFAAAHKYLVDSVITVSGATEAAYNGEFRVISASTDTVVVSNDNGTPAANTATGTLTMKVAPLGWTITHESGDGKIFIVRPTDVSASGNVSLRIDNSAWSGWKRESGQFSWYLAKVAMVEDVTDLNTYTEIFDHRWPATGRFSNKRWDLIGDSQLFYFLPAFGQHNQQACYPFGYIKSIRPGDRYHAILDHYASKTLPSSDDYSWAWGNLGNILYGDTFGKLNDASQRVMARPYHQLFGTTGFSLLGLFSLFGTGLSVPNGPDNGFYVSIDPIMVLENGNHLRGYMPGLVNPYGSIVAWNRKNFGYLPALPGKIVRFIHIQRNTDLYNVPATMCGFDIVGPWR